MTALLVNEAVESGSTQPLLLNSKAKEEDEDQECDGAEEDSNDIQKPVTSLVLAYRLLTPSVKVWINSKFYLNLFQFMCYWILVYLSNKKKKKVLLDSCHPYHHYLGKPETYMVREQCLKLDEVSVLFHSIFLYSFIEFN